MGANNMDSVFANCTDAQEAFDVMFDEDDILIDTIAGVDEAGVPLTGEDFDWSKILEADDMVGDNPDFDYQKDGDAAGSEKDAEGTKDIKPEIGGEVGDGKEVSGKENSAESQAHDDTKEVDNAIGLTDKQQVELEAEMVSEAITLVETVNQIALMEDDETAATDDEKKKNILIRIKDTVLKAIKGLIEKIQGFINKIKTKKDKTPKDNEKVSKLNGVLSKIKGLFSKAKNSSDPEEVKQAGQDAKAQANEVTQIVNNGTVQEAMDPIFSVNDTSVVSESDDSATDDEKKKNILIRIKDTVLKAIKTVIEKIQGLINKIKTKKDKTPKDNEKESKLKSLLNKVKSLFSKAKNSSDPEEVKNCGEVTKEVSNEAQGIVASNDTITTHESTDEGPLKDDDVAEREGEVPPTAVETEATDSTPNADPPTKDDAKELKATMDQKECCKESAPDVTEPGDEVSLSESIIAKIKAKREEVHESNELLAKIEAEKKQKRAIREKQEYNDMVDKVLETMTEEELSMRNALDLVKEKVALLKEGKCPKCGNTECTCDAAERAGDVKHSTSNVEGEDSEGIGAAIAKNGISDPIIDLDDTEARNGKTDSKNSGIEAVKSTLLGKAFEAAVLEDSDNVDDLLDDDDEIIDIDISDDVVPDNVKEDDTSNDIDIKKEDFEGSYTGWRVTSEAAKKDDEEIDIDLDDDDADIEAIDKQKDPKGSSNLSYDYDDDELIDITIDGNNQ